MDLKTNIKLGEVTNLSDARFAAGRGAQFVGFNFTPGHHAYIEPEQAGEIAGWLDGPSLVGEWESALPAIIYDTHERLRLDYVQLNRPDAGLAKAVYDLRLIQNISIGAQTHAAEVIEQVDSVHLFTHHFMLTFHSLEAQDAFLGIAAHRQLVQELCKDYPVLLNFIFTPENLIPLLETYSPFGINLKGGQEMKPGLKDFDVLNDLVDLLEF